MVLDPVILHKGRDAMGGHRDGQGPKARLTALKGPDKQLLPLTPRKLFPKLGTQRPQLAPVPHIKSKTPGDLGLGMFVAVLGLHFERVGSSLLRADFLVAGSGVCSPGG